MVQGLQIAIGVKAFRYICHIGVLCMAKTNSYCGGEQAECFGEAQKKTRGSAGEGSILIFLGFRKFSQKTWECASNTMCLTYPLNSSKQSTEVQESKESS